MIDHITQQLNEHKRNVQAQIKSLESEVSKIEDALGSLASIDGGAGSGMPSPFVPAPAGKKKGGMSAAGREAIRQAQIKRWATINQGKAPAAAKTGKRKNKISAAGLAKIKAAQKARWAAYNKAKAGKK